MIRSIELVEASQTVDLIEFSGQQEIGLEALIAAIQECNRVINNAVNVKTAIQISNGRLKVNGVAGVISINDRIQIEIIPKFLAHAPSWKEDFLFISHLSRFGHVLPQEALHAESASDYSLTEFIAHAAIRLFDRSRRRSLRLYRLRSWNSWEIEGDVEAEEFYYPSNDGFRQQSLVLDSSNSFVKTIRDGLVKLASEVRSQDSRRGLESRIGQLSSSFSEISRKRRLPSRHTHWKDLLELCQTVIEGSRWSIGTQNGVLPGFVLNTAKAWESVLRHGLRGASSPNAVASMPYRLGILNVEGDQSYQLNSWPDMSLFDGAELRLIADAKYKALMNGRPSRSDIYEMLGFLEAANCHSGVLLFPFFESEGTPPGTVKIESRIKIKRRIITSIKVSINGIAKEGGYWKYCQNLSDGLNLSNLEALANN